MGCLLCNTDYTSFINPKCDLCNLIYCYGIYILFFDFKMVPFFPAGCKSLAGLSDKCELGGREVYACIRSDKSPCYNNKPNFNCDNSKLCLCFRRQIRLNSYKVVMNQGQTEHNSVEHCLVLLCSPPASVWWETAAAGCLWNPLPFCLSCSR